MRLVLKTVAGAIAGALALVFWRRWKSDRSDQGSSRASLTAPSTEMVGACWSAMAESYHRWSHARPAYRQAWVDALAGLVGHPRRDGSPVLRIADVGTGTGEIALLLAQMGHEVTGYDIAPGMLDRARTNAEAAGLAVRLVRGDAYELPLADRSVDAVVSRIVFWTLYDPTRALHEWQRVLAPGGRIVVIDTLNAAPPRTVSQWVRRLPGRVLWDASYRFDQVKNRLQRGGDYQRPADPYAVSQPPGRRWTSPDDARAQFTQAGLDGVTQSWLDIDRRTASLRWRISVSKPPHFFALTWKDPSPLPDRDHSNVAP